MKPFYYQTPRWASSLLNSVALLLGLALLTLLAIQPEELQHTPVVVPALLAIVALVFIVVGLKPDNWQPWTYFYADSIGLHFPDQCPQKQDSQWLTVEWSRVGAIQKETFINLKKGPSIQLQLDDRDIDTFFRADRISRQLLATRQDDGFFTIGYSNAFQDAGRVVEQLNTMKRRFS